MIALWQHRASLLSAALLACLWGWRGSLVETGALRAQLAARPQVSEDSKLEKERTIKRGPIKVTRKVVTAPDGTKTVESTREVGGEVEHVELERESRREEAAPSQPRAPRWYAGVGLSPLDPKKPLVRAGTSLWGRLDLGLAYLTSRPLGQAMMVEASLRF